MFFVFFCFFKLLLLQIWLRFSPVCRSSSNVQSSHRRLCFPFFHRLRPHYTTVCFIEMKWKPMCNWFYFSVKMKTAFTCCIEIKCVCSHTSCTYQIENKAEGCSILFATSPASACPPSSPLHSAACCWDTGGSFQRSSRHSLGCQMSDVTGLHTEVFFSERWGGRPVERMELKKCLGEKRNICEC